MTVNTVRQGKDSGSVEGVSGIWGTDGCLRLISVDVVTELERKGRKKGNRKEEGRWKNEGLVTIDESCDAFVLVVG